MRYTIQLTLTTLALFLSISMGHLAALELEPLDIAIDTPKASPDFTELGISPVLPPTTTPEQRSNVLLVPRDRTRVAILGYHDFSSTKPATPMRITTAEFERQMSYIQSAGLTVITMKEFLEWLYGARQLPEQCVLITIDDGWRSVYQEAYPILKKYNFPFTIFLYTQFISGRGQSMTHEMIREMQANGATVGSHSRSHAYPSEWKQADEMGAEAMDAMVERELGSSKRILDSLFGTVNTYCYPGGFVMQPMIDKIASYGYAAGFTVISGKVTSQENPWKIHRYIVLGNDDNRIFDLAMDFRLAAKGSAISTGSIPGTLPPTTPLPPFSVYPAPTSSVADNAVEVKAELNGVAGIDFSSVQMRVSGYGLVPINVDELSRTLSWTPPSRVYLNNLSVHVTWKTQDNKRHKAEWSFRVFPAQLQ